MHSNLSIWKRHHAYQSIVEMGQNVIPIIINHLRSGAACHISMAVNDILGYQPVEFSVDEQGRLPIVIQKYIDWGTKEFPPSPQDLHYAAELAQEQGDGYFAEAIQENGYKPLCDECERLSERCYAKSAYLRDEAIKLAKELRGAKQS